MCFYVKNRFLALWCIICGSSAVRTPAHITLSCLNLLDKNYQVKTMPDRGWPSKIHSLKHHNNKIILHAAQCVFQRFNFVPGIWYFVYLVETAHTVRNFLRRKKLVCSLFRKLFAHFSEINFEIYKKGCPITSVLMNLSIFKITNFLNRSKRVSYFQGLSTFK